MFVLPLRSWPAHSGDAAWEMTATIRTAMPATTTIIRKTEPSVPDTPLSSARPVVTGGLPDAMNIDRKVLRFLH